MGYYDGISAFNRWRWSLDTPPNYDWADLTDSERRLWALREKDQERTEKNDSD